MNKEILSFMKMYFQTCHISSYNTFDSDSLTRYVLYWCVDDIILHKDHYRANLGRINIVSVKEFQQFCGNGN